MTWSTKADEAYKERRRAKGRETQKLFRERHPEREKTLNKSKSLRRHGITEKDFNLLWASQNKQCAICSIEMVLGGYEVNTACIDHDHVTGKIRGILCRFCNSGLGHFKDSVLSLKHAQRYLEESQ